MKSLSVTVEFSYGWCVLGMQAGGSSVEIKNHWLNDCFTELVQTVRQLLEGKESASCRWQHEVSGGSFIDLVADPGGGISIAVHEFYYGNEADSYETIWSARRGALLFEAHVPMADFINEFAGALRWVRALRVDPTGFIEHWKYTFPDTTFQFIESRAAAFGYQPKSMRQILGEAEASG